jgi:hypothetical protein
MAQGLVANESCVIDEGQSDKSFSSTRSRMASAVRDGRLEAIEDFVDDDIVFGFDGSSGRGAFIESLKDSRQRTALLDALSLGGRFQLIDNQPGFWAPFVYTVPLWDTSMPERYVIPLYRPLDIYSQASPTSRILDRFDCQPVLLAEKVNLNKDSWYAVLVRGARGYVSRLSVRSPLDYRAGFVRVKRGWVLKYFVSGD